jgi:hypothetical protein
VQGYEIMSRNLKVDYRTVDYAELDTDYLFDEIRAQFEPEEVFSYEQLKNWAIDNNLYNPSDKKDGH